MSWDKKLFPLPDGRIVEARMPVIVSASRRTDIPAFYADWFFDRLEKGYSLWANPFNKQESYVSYRNTSFIVFWSKNPRPLTGKLPILASKRIGCYIQYTLNDYEREGLEPNVPPLAERIETFRLLSERLGKKAVIWRFDPLLLTEDLSIDGLLQKVERKSDLERWDARHRNEREPGSVLVYVTRLSEFRNEADRSLNHFFTRCGLAWWPPTTSHPPLQCQTLPRKRPHAAACRLPAICQASGHRAS